MKWLSRNILDRLSHLGISRQLLFLLMSQAITAITGLLYGKLITLFISPAVVGEYNVQLVTMLVVIAIFASPTIQAFMSASQQQGLAAIMPFYTKLTAAFGVCSLLLIFTFYVLNYVEVWCFAAWATGLFQCLFTFCMGFFLVKNQLKTYALLQSLNPILNLLLLLFVLFVLEQPTITGLWLNILWLNGTLLVIAAYLAHRLDPDFRPTLKKSELALSKRVVTSFLAFVSPLLGYALFSSLNNYADRYIIKYLMAPASVGFYMVAYSLGSRLSVIGSPFVNHLNALMYAARREEKHAETTPLIIKHLTMFWAVGIPVCAIMYVFSTEIGLLLLSPIYKESFQLIPIIALASVLLHSVQLFETKFYVYGKTKYILLHSIIGAVINLCLNWLLIPLFGIKGAAFSTLLSFFSQFVLLSLLNKFVQFQNPPLQT